MSEPKSGIVNAYRITVVSAVLILVIGMAVTFVFLQRNSEPPASSSTYAIPIITTNNRPLCPGDTVIYDQVAHFRNTPAAFRVVSTLWNVDKNITVIPDRDSSYVNYMAPTTVKLHGEWPIPADLPAGHYECRISTTAEARQSQMFVVTFIVDKDCPHGK